MKATEKNIKALAKKYDVEEKVVKDLLNEGFTMEEAEEIIYEAEY